MAHIFSVNVRQNFPRLDRLGQWKEGEAMKLSFVKSVHLR